MTDATPVTAPRPLAALATVLCAALVLGEVAARVATVQPAVANRVVPMHSAGVLRAKLDLLAGHEGARIALLGDSLIVGRSMLEHGDADWRAHTLDALLQATCDERLPAREALVVNLGLDGAVPADILALARRSLAAWPDLLLIDLNLRSFSRDFAAPGTQHTRDWLAPPGGDSPAARANAAIEDSLAGAARVSRLYTGRDLLQASVLGGGPKQWLTGLHHRWLDVEPEADEDLEEMLLLLKARQRFSRVDLQPDNPQRQALEALLDLLREADVPCVLFYAREDPERMTEVVERPRYEALRTELRALVEPKLGPRMTYLDGPADLPSARYLDHVHVDREGYQVYLEHLWPACQAALAPVREDE